jgi:hypothetical protein
LYHTCWIYILPHFGKYTIRQELIILDDETAKVHRLVKVPNTELAIWDAEHDVLGNRVAILSQLEKSSDESERLGSKEKE